MTLHWTTAETTLGPFVVVARDDAVVRILLPASDDAAAWDDLATAYPGEAVVEDADRLVLKDAVDQLTAYTRGERSRLTFPVAPHGTPFQRAVWDTLRRIPAGEVWSYAQVAHAIGKPGAARAIGQANRRNPVPVAVPCHRVVTAQGTIGGYMGRVHGRDTLKRRLLELEGVRLPAEA